MTNRPSTAVDFPSSLAETVQFWMGLAHGSLGGFTQPILPGWTFNIDSNNSRSPETEQEIVSRLSYGSQLGKITEALAGLIELTAPESRARFDGFLQMKAEIDRIKNRNVAARIEQLRRDVERLRVDDPEEFALVSAALRRIA